MSFSFRATDLPVYVLISFRLLGVYTSSKAALNMLSETLRLELSPFGVEVVTVMVGVIDTPFHANEISVSLPPTSAYSPIKDTIAKLAAGEGGPKGTPPHELAEALVVDIVGGGKGGLVWKGALSGTMKFASQWVPKWFLVSVHNTPSSLILSTTSQNYTGNFDS